MVSWTLVNDLALEDLLLDLGLVDVRHRDLEQIVIEQDHVCELAFLDGSGHLIGQWGSDSRNRVSGEPRAIQLIPRAQTSRGAN